MRLALILAAALLIASCSPTGHATKENDVAIGGAFILSGIGADWGEAERNGAQLALEEFNNNHSTTITMVVESTSYENPKTLLAVQKLATVDRVPVIIGPTWLGGLQASAAAAEEAGVVLITPSDSITTIKAEEPYPHAFATWYRADAETAALAEHLKEQGFTAVALLYGNDPFWQDFKKQFLAAAQREGLNVAADLGLGPHEKDFRTALLKLAANEPDVVVFGLDDEAAFLQLFKERQHYLPDTPFYSTELTEGFAADEKFSGIMTGVRFVAPTAPDETFSERYETRYGVAPVFSAANAYDATTMALEAIAAGNTDGDAIREYLQTHEFDTVTFGRVRFDELGGIAGGSFVFKEVDERNRIKTIGEGIKNKAEIPQG